MTSDPEGGFIVSLLWLEIHSLLTLSAWLNPEGQPRPPPKPRHVNPGWGCWTACLQEARGKWPQSPRPKGPSGTQRSVPCSCLTQLCPNRLGLGVHTHTPLIEPLPLPFCPRQMPLASRLLGLLALPVFRLWRCDGLAYSLLVGWKFAYFRHWDLHTNSENNEVNTPLDYYNDSRTFLTIWFTNYCPILFLFCWLLLLPPFFLCLWPYQGFFIVYASLLLP